MMKTNKTQFKLSWYNQSVVSIKLDWIILRLILHDYGHYIKMIFNYVSSRVSTVGDTVITWWTDGTIVTPVTKSDKTK